MVSLNCQPPPSSHESECALISAAFLDGIQTLNKCVVAGITLKSFYTTQNKILWETILSLSSEGKPFSLDVVAEELRKKNLLGEVGGFTYLVEVSSVYCTEVNLQFYLDRVKSAYISRELISSAEKVIALARTEEAEPEVFSHEIGQILSLRNGLGQSKSLSQATQDSISRIERFRDGKASEEDIGLEWPWGAWNERFGPAAPGRSYVIAARPSGGKSSTLRQALDYWAGRYGNVLLFSREMMMDEMPPLFAQMRCGLSYRDIKKGKLRPAEIQVFLDTLQEFKEEKRLHIFDREKTLSQVIARSRAEAQVRNVKAIGIDYLQRYDPEIQKGETRDTAVGRMTMAFKDLAIDLGIPCIILAQLNRAAEREKRQLQMSDLRESGSIEQDADNIIFLEPPAVDPITGCAQNAEDDGTTQLYISARQAKGRADGRAQCGMYFHLPTTTMRSAVAPRQEPYGAPPVTTSRTQARDSQD